MKIGDILACRDEDSLISEAICLITNSYYSHVGIIISNTQIVESDGVSGFVRYRDIEDYRGKAVIYTCDSLSDKQRQDIVYFAKKEVGRRYDRLLLLWLFVKYVFRLKLPYINDSSMICSELVNKIFKSSIGIRLSKKRFPIPDDVINSKLLRFSENY